MEVRLGMKIVVFGANGGIGRLAVDLLLAEGHEVTAVVRNAGKLPERPGLSVHTVPDMLDPRNLVPVLSGQDAALSGVGPRSTKDGPIASTVTSSILAAMKEAGVRRLVAVSAAPVGDTPPDEGLFGRLILYPIARTLLKPVFADLGAMEASMWASGLDCTTVRPPRLTDGPLTRKYRQRVGGSLPNSLLISRADTADAMLAALGNAATIGQPVGVAN